MPVGPAYEARKSSCSTPIGRHANREGDAIVQRESLLTCLFHFLQQARRYATQPPSGGNNTLLYVLGGAALLGGGYYFTQQNPGAAQKAEAKVKEALPVVGVKKALTGGEQGFVSLKLEDVENVNHNTKKFRFKLPEDDMVSGLEVASAILTKFKPEGEGKPVLRPYTPVSDEGRFWLSFEGRGTM